MEQIAKYRLIIPKKTELFNTNLLRNIKQLNDEFFNGRNDKNILSPEIIKHSYNVGIMSYNIYNELYSELNPFIGYIGGIFHDIGKYGLDLNILFQERKLDSSEKLKIQNHVTLGVEIFKSRFSQFYSPELNGHILDAIKYHHLNEDGTGYSCGDLYGENIPIVAKIIHMADVIETLFARRVYKEPLHMDDVLKRILSNSYKGIRYQYFDYEILDTAIDLLPSFELLYKNDINNS